jgi:DnaJ-domain-containing protein 1
MIGRANVVVIVAICFALGYRLVSVLLERRSKHAERRSATADRTQDDPESIEGYYRKVLRVSESAGEEEIRTGYRTQLAKYHPDKVTHLGDEFYDLASRRTKEIIEAYEYFKRQYGYK